MNFHSYYIFIHLGTILQQVAKQRVAPQGESIPFAKRVAMAAFAGCCGGFIGTPGDMINVRMQNDIKLPADKRRK